MNDDHHFDEHRQEQVWARIEAAIAADHESSDRRPVRVLRAAVIALWLGFGAAFVAVAGDGRPPLPPSAGVDDLSDLAARAREGRADPNPWPMHLAITTAATDRTPQWTDELWLDDDGTGCLLSGPELTRAAAEPQCTKGPAQVGGLTRSDLAQIGPAPTATAVAARIVANDASTATGVHAEYVISLLAWEGVDPELRAVGFELLADYGYRVTRSTDDRVVLEGPGQMGAVVVTVDRRTTVVRSLDPHGGPPKTFSAATNHPLPDS